MVESCGDSGHNAHPPRRILPLPFPEIRDVRLPSIGTAGQRDADDAVCLRGFQFD